jgi:hypothetical protein
MSCAQSAQDGRLLRVSISFTEGGDAELTDREMLAQARHTTVKVLPKYTKRTTRRVMNGAKKRRAPRTKSDQSSE